MPSVTPPRFDQRFIDAFSDLVAWRRDVRRFSPTPVAQSLLDKCLCAADLAPSVGNSQPWRWIAVEKAALRDLVKSSFAAANAAATARYQDEEAERYARLKLAGLDTAPAQFAVFCDETTLQGRGLGRQTMPETLRYSTVCSVHTFWLAARAQGLGLGWVSILDPAAVCGALHVPATWSLVAYLCVGYPLEEHLDPELQRHGWQARTPDTARFTRC